MFSCEGCSFKKSMALFSACAGLKRERIGDRPYCSHVGQLNPAPIIEGNVVRGGICPLVIDKDIPGDD